MAKGYKKTERAFGVGDIAVLTEKDGRTIPVRILGCIAEDGEWWYEVYPTAFNPPITREVPQSMLDRFEDR